METHICVNVWRKINATVGSSKEAQLNKTEKENEFQR